MATPSKVGPRFLIPSTFPASQQFVEMRRVGLFPLDALFAVLYGYLEHALTLGNREMILALERLQIPGGNAYFQRVLEEIGNPQINFDFEELDRVARSLAQANKVETTIAYRIIETSKTLCSQLGISASLYFVPVSLSQNPLSNPYKLASAEGSTMELYICADEEKVYLLYKNLTKESFVQVSCGHLLLKYDLLDFFKASAGGYPFGDKDYEELTYNCIVCNNPIAGNDLLQVLPALWDRRMPTNVSFGPYQCGVCFEARFSVTTCISCHISICINCAVIRATSVTGPICQCGVSFLHVLMGNWEVIRYQRLSRIIQIADAESQGIRARQITPSFRVQQTTISMQKRASLPQNSSKYLPSQRLLKLSSAQGLANSTSLESQKSKPANLPLQLDPISQLQPVPSQIQSPPIQHLKDQLASSQVQSRYIQHHKNPSSSKLGQESSASESRTDSYNSQLVPSQVLAQQYQPPDPPRANPPSNKPGANPHISKSGSTPAPCKPGKSSPASKSAKDTRSSQVSNANCKICNSPMTGEFFLCNSKCCCFNCELKSFYSTVTPNTKCPHCKKSNEVYATEVICCKNCKQPYCYIDLYYYCLVCQIRLCLKCARENREAVLICKSTGEKHYIQGQKELLLFKENKECLVF